MLDISDRIAQELGVHKRQIDATIELLDGGATVPFIARYRKEVTGSLDDVQLRTLDQRLNYLRELEERRATVLKSIEEQGKLSPPLKQSVLEADTKTRLEDLYRPYMPKRRTKAQIAREAGLEPLADTILEDSSQDLNALAEAYINAEHKITNAEEALDGAKQILMENFAEDAELNGRLRESLWENGHVRSSVVSGKENEGEKFRDYFDMSEPLANMPSHRALALFRGRNEGFLQLQLTVKEGEEETPAAEAATYSGQVCRFFNIEDNGHAGDKWLMRTATMAWRVKMFTRLDTELKLRLKQAAEEEAIRVFASNLNDLLMAAPAGSQVTMGLDPGFRTGVKVAVIDGTGKVLATATIYPHEPQKQHNQSLATLGKLVDQHKVSLIAIGNGTASRETERLAADLIKLLPEKRLQKIVVSEAGASVYSASELASAELADMDVSLRGAVSIARRLQDPLAELVKIDPKSIGVGQYQHDVNQTRLARSLEAIVEDCVNAVGVDLNMASPALLSHVSGLNKTLADNIVAYRNQQGAFENRNALMKVARLGEKVFQQCAGFLRLPNSNNPLDASAVHPEAYPLVKDILSQSNSEIKNLMGKPAEIRKLDANAFVSEQYGLPTIQDILKELEKPGRDPRPEFVTAKFTDGVEKVSHLKPGMLLEGVVTNVTNFGAFIDIGVHQDGLVHISQMAEKFIKDPREVVKTGQVVKVKVMEVDVQRNRVGLSMRLSDKPEDQANNSMPRDKPGRRSQPKQRQAEPQNGGALAMALAAAKSSQSKNL